jgi:hypothetical protein
MINCPAPRLRRRLTIARPFRIGAAILALALLPPGLVAASMAPASAASNILGSGQRLNGGQEITAGNYWLIMQTDGNLVEYDSAGAQWASDTAGEAGNYVIMQTDGNLVVYSSGGQWRWQSGTYGYSGAYLAVQTDGNVVVYSSGGSPLWAKSWTQSAAGAQAYAQILFVHYGWSVSGQYPYLNDLWTRESNWRWNICNGGGTYPTCDYTGIAYGIPQSDPGSKMAANGPDWPTDGLTQVAWGLAYISSAYGNPENAWNHDVNCGYCGYSPTQ